MNRALPKLAMTLWLASLSLSAATPVLAAENLEANSVPSRVAAGATPSARASNSQTWYARSRVETEYGMIMTHYWSKGPMFRAETVVAGHPITTIVNGPRYYVYDSATADGAAIERNATAIEEDASRGRPFGRELQDLIDAGGEKINEGSLGEGAMGFEVYQLTNENGRRRVLVTRSDLQIPIKIETFVRETGTTGIMEYSSWQRGIQLEDSFFQPPNTIVFEKISYPQYTADYGRIPIGPAPVYYRHLLHGSQTEAR
jgi:outer membrane lipoprotein-sorting protein